MSPSRGEKDRARYRQAATSRSRAAPRPAATTAVPAQTDEGTTRMTLDLTTAQRRALARWTAQAGLELDRTRLGAAAVLRAAIEVLEEEPVRAAVLRRLQDE